MLNMRNTSIYNYCILLCLTCLSLLIGQTVAMGDNPIIPIPDKYLHFNLARPIELSPLTKEEIKINPDRIFTVLKKDPPGTTRKLLRKYAESLQDEKIYDEFWDGCRDLVDWKLPDNNYKNFKYLSLKVAPLYLFTGNIKVGRYIHDYMMETATFNTWFWITRKPQADKNWATLHTSYIIRDYIYIMLYARDVFSDEEYTRLETQLLKWGHQTSYKWTKECQYNNNWVAVVCGGLLMSSKYFNDDDSKYLAMEKLRQYLDSTFEDDGSYGEQLHYFHYGANSMLTPFMILDDIERKELFANSNLRYSPDWSVYHYFFKSVYPGQKFPFNVGFGDNNYFDGCLYKGSSASLYYVLSYLYNSKSAAFLGERFDGDDWVEACDRNFDLGWIPPSTDASELNLPLFRTFKNGETIIRSGWEDDAIVFGTQLNVNCRLQAHQRPENGNFILGAYGIPVVMHPGNTNRYFDAIYKYSVQTSSANTIVIDGENQLPANETQGLKYLVSKSTDTVDVVIMDLKPAYKAKMNRVERSVVYLKAQKCFAIIDYLNSKDDTTHSYQPRVNFNNIRQDATLIDDGDHCYRYQHPFVNMNVVVGGNHVIKTRLDKSFVCSDLYDKFDPRQEDEMKKGNAFRLIYGPVDQQQSALIFAVFQLTSPEDKGGLAVNLKNNVLYVNEDQIRVLPNGISVIIDENINSFYFD